MAAVQAVTQVQQQQQGQVASSSTGTTGERSWSRLSPKPRCLNRGIESKRHHRIPNRCLEVETEAKLRAGEMLAVRRRGGLGPPPTEVRRCCGGLPARLQPSFLFPFREQESKGVPRHAVANPLGGFSGHQPFYARVLASERGCCAIVPSSAKFWG